VTEPIDLPAAQARFDEPWSDRTVAVLNDYELRVVKTKGEFTRHRHLETDGVFLVLGGSLTIGLDDDEVILGPGQPYVVPRGVHHQPVSVEGAASRPHRAEHARQHRRHPQPPHGRAAPRLTSTRARPPIRFRTGGQLVPDVGKVEV